MRKVTTVLSVFSAVVFCAAPAVRAQATSPATEKLYININFGEQLAERSASATPPSIQIYGEEATLISTQPVKRGPVYDVDLGFRVWHDFYAGIQASWYVDTEEAKWTASVPNPVFFNRPAERKGEFGNLKRMESTYSPHVSWPMTLTDRLDVVFAGGVSIVEVRQDLPGTFSVVSGTQNVIVATKREKAKANGPYGAVDVVYNLMSKIGVGGYVRYAGAKVDLPSHADTNVGGLQVGGGVRLRLF